jgi:hypothetical protein
MAVEQKYEAEPIIIRNVCLTFIKTRVEIIKFFSPIDAQVNCLKINFKIYIKIYIKTAPTCFGVITIIRECTI